MAAVKLAVTADLHLPVSTPEQLLEVAGQIASFQPDAVVLAGNLADSLAGFKRCLQLFAGRLSCPIHVLAGDQDFFARPPYDSQRLWNELLPQAVRSTGCHWLEGQAFTLGAIAVAGTVAWYDYSSADPGLAESAPDYAQRKYEFNADALRIDWEWSDPEFAALVGARFLATLDHLEANPRIRQTVAVTHFPLLDEQLPPPEPSRAFPRAYLGNLKLGQQVLTRSKVSHLVSGHTHTGYQGRRQRPGASDVEVQVVPSQYEKPAWVGLTL
jgi:hypothetical protein